jgi:Fe-S cluster assembly ATPase SufC
LDEIDSGLDVDAIKIICEGIRKNREVNSSLIVITHYPRILNYLIPNFVHIMIDGKIVKSGNMELVNYLEENYGITNLIKEAIISLKDNFNKNVYDIFIKRKK